MPGGVGKLVRLIPIGNRRVAQNLERPQKDVNRFATELVRVLLPLGISLAAAVVSRVLGKSSNTVLQAGAVHAGRVRQSVAPSSISLTSELIRLLPLIPSPFLGGKLLLAQRLMRRHKMLVPLLVAGHSFVRRSRR
jgi:hypothetical protein